MFAAGLDQAFQKNDDASYRERTVIGKLSDFGREAVEEAEDNFLVHGDEIII